MRVLVPFDARTPKSRLADVLDTAERSAFAAAMLADVLAAVRAAGGDPTVVATAPVDADAVAGTPVEVDDRSLSVAVGARLDDLPAAVVMADLALADARSVRRLFDAPGEVVLAPGRGGGTNALVVGAPGFSVDYHGASYRDHLRAARDAGLSVFEVDSARLGLDVDEAADLPDVLLRGDGRAAAWLRERFAVTEVDGRVGVRRH